MRYFVAFLAAVALSWGYLELSRNVFGHALGENAVPFGLAAMFCIFVLCFITAQSVEPAPLMASDFRARVDGRFPENYIFRVPSDVIDYLVKRYSYEEIPLSLREHDRNLWQRIFDNFPDQPSDEVQRKEGEKLFWQTYLYGFSVKRADGTKTLKNKQQIMDYFNHYEKWIFREYYAATGIVHDTIMIRKTRVVEDVLEANRMVGGFGADEKMQAKKDAATERALEALKRFDLEIEKPHLAEWGEWFFFHIREAYLLSQQKDADIGPQTAASAVILPDRETEWRPNV